MDTIDTKADDTRLPADIDAQPLVQAAAALKPVIRTYQEEIEREQRMPPALVGQMREAGFYKMVIPRSLGGLQLDTLTFLRVVELVENRSDQRSEDRLIAPRHRDLPADFGQHDRARQQTHPEAAVLFGDVVHPQTEFFGARAKALAQLRRQRLARTHLAFERQQLVVDEPPHAGLYIREFRLELKIHAQFSLRA